jgi:hypothetical protein
MKSIMATAQKAVAADQAEDFSAALQLYHQVIFIIRQYLQTSAPVSKVEVLSNYCDIYSDRYGLFALNPPPLYACPEPPSFISTPAESRRCRSCSAAPAREASRQPVDRMALAGLSPSLPLSRPCHWQHRRNDATRKVATAASPRLSRPPCLPPLCRTCRRKKGLQCCHRRLTRLTQRRTLTA